MNPTPSGHQGTQGSNTPGRAQGAMPLRREEHDAHASSSKGKVSALEGRRYVEKTYDYSGRDTDDNQHRETDSDGDEEEPRTVKELWGLTKSMK